MTLLTAFAALALLLASAGTLWIAGVHGDATEP